MKDKNKEIFHKLIWYILIFSIFGLIIETVYCFATTGVLESRKGLIIGPVCPIYGIGASIIIFALNRFKGHKIKLIILGLILGSVTEYCISFGLEAMYGTRFWEYSYMKLQLNGRISIIYSLFWGVLTVLIIEYVQPIVDKLILRIKQKWIDIVLLVIFIIDIIFTIWGINVYTERILYGRNYREDYSKIQKFKYDMEEKCFSNDIMVKVFPNLRIMDKDGNEIYVKDLFKNNEI